MTMIDRITEVLQIHGDSCTRGNARYLAEKVAELFTEEERIGQAGDFDERHLRRWVSDWSTDD